jgi:hypothetical protein
MDGFRVCHFLLWFDYSKCCKFFLGAAGSTRNSSSVEEGFGGEVQMQQVEQHNVGAEHMSRFVSLPSDASDAVAQAEPEHSMILPFQPLGISFDNINYYVNMPVVCVFFF